MNRSLLLKALEILPWVTRTPGQEVNAQVLKQVCSPALTLDDSSGGQLDRPAGHDLHGARLPKGTQKPSRNRSISQTNSQQVGAFGATVTQKAQSTSEPPLALSSSSRVDSVRSLSGSSDEQLQLSFLYAQVHPKLWLVAECHEWDQDSQQTFERLASACMKFSAADAQQFSDPQWFHWPMRLPVPVLNDKRALRQALRGWVQGKKSPGTLWVSLGKRFVDYLLDQEMALVKGEVHQGRSEMAVVWFDSLAAMSIEPQVKASLWNFIRQKLSVDKSSSSE